MFKDRFPTLESFIVYVTNMAPHLTDKVTWSTGGIRGGSCWDWDEENHYSYDSDEREPDLTELDTFLVKLYPDLTYLQYRSLMRETFIEIQHRSENEYYGNYTYYTDKWINLSKLYAALVKVL